MQDASFKLDLFRFIPESCRIHLPVEATLALTCGRLSEKQLRLSPQLRPKVRWNLLKLLSILSMRLSPFNLDQPV